MCNGKSVYHGSSKEILSYFSEQGYQCELHDNPADFVLDVLIDVSQDENDLEKLYISYKKSSMYITMMNNINQQLHRNDVISEEKYVMKRSLSREICYLSIRTLINVIRNPELFMSQIVVAIILSLLAGLVFYDMKKTIDPGIPNRFGGIFFILTSQTFSAVTSLEPLLNDRVLFIRVNHNN
jgi:ATP-binding cassette subfamily G (WHITE) protein 2